MASYFVMKKFIFSKSNYLKIVSEGKKMEDENRNKYRSFKSWERDNFMGHTQRRSYLIWSGWPRLDGFTIRL